MSAAAGEREALTRTDDWHAADLQGLLDRLSTGVQGLREAEAQQRLHEYGPNSLRLARPTSAWRILLEQFRGVVVLLLVAAMTVAWLLGDPIEAIAIFGVLIINAALGFVTELRARSAMAALLALEVPHATVLRDGRAREIEATTLVPGDVILIEAGQAVPADARLLQATELRTSEAALTGESLPVDKRADVVLGTDTPLAERINSIYMSTNVVAGTARAVVTATGNATEVGHIGGLVAGIHAERTPLERRLDVLGGRLVGITLVVAATVIVAGMLRDEPVGQLVETAIALAIAAVPEGLAAVSTIALAIGTARMARRNALVRRLPAVESLGSVTVVCTDKTGTLTAGEMTVTELWVAGRTYEVTGAGYTPEGDILRDGTPVDAERDAALRSALRVGALANNADLLHTAKDGWTIRGDPTEAALLVLAEKAGLDRNALPPRSREMPFSSERMLMASFHSETDHTLVAVKGAPARVVEACVDAIGDPTEKLDDAAREAILVRNRDMAARGLRVLALAQASVPLHRQPDDAGSYDHGVSVAAGRSVDTAQELPPLTFAGLVGISDPPAAGVRETIDALHAAGIRTIMITGDQKLTAQAIARELGIMGEDDLVLDARELQAHEVARSREQLRRIAALSRISPEDKLHIVEALQQRGEIVAMLGDGVNDAAALKKADIGVAMGGRGTDVAKEAAGVVLRDDRFQTIGAAVEEGRVIFDNIRRFVFYLFSCNLAEVLVILGASILGMPQPLLPLQILWLNLVTDTFPALSLAAEPGDRSVMRRPPRDPNEAILSPGFLRRIALFAALITIATLGAFLYALQRDDPDRAVTIAFMTLALAQAFHLGNARSRTHVLGWGRMIANRWAIAAVLLTVALQFLALYFAPLARLLDVVPLTREDWMIVVPAALMPAVIGQLIGWLSREREGAERAPT
ncbi:MAG TPA: HAD-IC family P-type ATPase [Longimicrobiales bacterium]|nr:HAD-IC family P-type ATPase [Longimicrobiales bacterium]